MQDFMGKNVLLRNETAKTLYHEYAAHMPIIDYHCHIDPRQIMENMRFENITKAWLGEDHYKWRLMRAMGVPEEFVTGSAPDREKFQKFCEIIPYCIGNPVHQWTHLELQRYFGCDLVINKENAQAVWDITGEKLKQDNFRVRGVIKASNVQAIGTTDDPADSLEWHSALRNDASNTVIVVPTMRPDMVISIDKPGFTDYMAKLAQVSGVRIGSVADLKSAMLKRITFFSEMGCRASDHGMGYVAYRPADEKTIEGIFQKGLAGGHVSISEAEMFKTNMMLFFGREFSKLGWAMQLHYGAQRDCNGAASRRLGPNTGFDAINGRVCGEELAAFLNALAEDGSLPKTILYSLNPCDNALLESIGGCFQGGGVGKIQHGSAWWFNDTKRGMEDHMLTMSSIGILGSFIGMLTDSRSFLSYTRHEYFRRILCNMVGDMVENGEYPREMNFLGTLVEDISYRNAAKYFGFEVKA